MIFVKCTFFFHSRFFMLGAPYAIQLHCTNFLPHSLPHSSTYFVHNSGRVDKPILHGYITRVGDMGKINMAL